MFQGFQTEAGDFFWELCFHNEREWFYAHKERFDTLIGTPMKELAAETYALLLRKSLLRKPMLFCFGVFRCWKLKCMCQGSGGMPGGYMDGAR